MVERIAHRAALWQAGFLLAVATLAAWARGEAVVDDRGSESAEKAFMVILAIALGTAVTGAAVAFVATKTALFK